MARKTASRIQKRKEIEAAGTRGAKGEAAAKKPAKRTRAPSRRKAKAAERKRLIWGVFSGSLKEEARFPYDQRAAAEERLEQLRAKGKKNYFIQPIKEVITAPAPAAAEAD
ncbi:MAG: hypothetical protein U0992_04725 [Planctomycetaceae bacterium]